MHLYGRSSENPGYANAPRSGTAALHSMHAVGLSVKCKNHIINIVTFRKFDVHDFADEPRARDLSKLVLGGRQRRRRAARWNGWRYFDGRSRCRLLVAGVRPSSGAKFHVI